MSRIFRFAAILAVAGFFMTSGLSADPWNQGDEVRYTLNSPTIGGYSYAGNLLGYGGLFTVTNQDTGAVVQTFCLELDEFAANPTYVEGVYDFARLGGRNTNADDPLDNATRWLYAQFLNGNAGYQNVQALQLAIWWLEEEFWDWQAGNFATPIDHWEWFYNGKLAGIGTAARGYVVDAWANANNAPSNIAVLSLRGGSDGTSGGYQQDYVIPVPEPAALALLGLGLLAVRLLPRRR